MIVNSATSLQTDAAPVFGYHAVTEGPHATRFSDTTGMDYAGFLRDARTIDAVLHNLEVIGEAAKQVPETLRARTPEIEWRKIAGLRDLIAHAYFEVDPEIIWDVVATKLGPLADAVCRIRSA